MRYKLLKANREMRETVLVVEHRPGAFARFFGSRTREFMYVGGGTVWRRFPSFERCPTWLEEILAQMSKSHEWRTRDGLAVQK